MVLVTEEVLSELVLATSGDSDGLIEFFEVLPGLAELELSLGLVELESLLAAILSVLLGEFEFIGEEITVLSVVVSVEILMPEDLNIELTVPFLPNSSTEVTVKSVTVETM